MKFPELLLKTTQNTNEAKALTILAKVRSAILEGGHDDLAAAGVELAELINEQSLAVKDWPLSPLVKPLIVIADILAADKEFLNAAIWCYMDAAHHSLGKDDDLNKQAVIATLKKAELLPTPEDRIATYQLALLNVPLPSAIARLAKHKAKEQEDPVYFKMRAPKELPRLEEAVVEGDLKASIGDGIRRAIRQQSQTGEIFYSVVVPRGLSRGKLADAGIQDSQKLRRISADEDLDRVIVPVNKLPLYTQRDIDLLTRLLRYGIYLDAHHGRIRDESGMVTSYKFPEGANQDRLRYMGIDTQAITPRDGKIIVPLEQINFHADPALIGKWYWVSAGGGNMKASIPENERATVIQSLKSYGITPTENKAGADKVDYLVVSRSDKGRLNNIIHQHILLERSKHLLNFAEALPAYASSIALPAYKDACNYFFGLRKGR
jgi:hypothetical protein